MPDDNSNFRAAPSLALPRATMLVHVRTIDDGGDANDDPIAEGIIISERNSAGLARKVYDFMAASPAESGAWLVRLTMMARDEAGFYIPREERRSFWVNLDEARPDEAADISVFVEG